MSKLRVGIIFGGRSGEHEVSIVSALSVYKALDKSKYDVELIGIDKSGRWLLPEDSAQLVKTADPRSIQLNQQKQTIGLLPFSYSSQFVPVAQTHFKLPAKFDVLFPVLHGTYGEDGTMQGLLELAQIAYVGSGVLGSSVGMDKDVSRRLLREAQIPTVPTLVFHQHNYLKNKKAVWQKCQEQLGLPFFVKPANSGSSVGIHKVKTLDQAEAAFADAFAFDTKILVEKSIAAREIECSVLGNHEPRASILGEIVPTHEFYSYEAKYIDENGASLHIPASNLTASQTKQIQEWAIQAFQVLDLSGLARVDFFVDKDTNQIYLNEVNTIPGFTNISMYPKMWEASGLPYPQLLDELIRLALARHQEKQNLKTSY